MLNLKHLARFIWGQVTEYISPLPELRPTQISPRTVLKSSASPIQIPLHYSSKPAQRSLSAVPSSASSYRPMSSTLRYNPTLTLDQPNDQQSELYISSRSVLSKHTFPVLRYIFLKTEELTDEEQIKSAVGTINVETVKRVWTLLLRDAVVEGMKHKTADIKINKEKSEAREREPVERRTEKKSEKGEVSGKGVYTNSLDSSSVEDFFVNTEEPTIGRTQHSFPGFPLLTNKDPQSLVDIPSTEVVVIIHCDTKEVYVRKTDGNVYRVKVKTEKEEAKKVEKRDLSGKKEDNDDREIAAIRKAVGDTRDMGNDWDDCKV